MTGQDTRNINLSIEESTVRTIFRELAIEIATARALSPPPADNKVDLRADYQTAVDIVKLLSDIRFKCLTFVTAVIAVASAIVQGTAVDGTKMALGLVGFLDTFGITLYDLRNSQLYDAAIHRAKYLEDQLEVKGSASHGERAGLFNERPIYVKEEPWK